MRASRARTDAIDQIEAHDREADDKAEDEDDERPRRRVKVFEAPIPLCAQRLQVPALGVLLGRPARRQQHTLEPHQGIDQGAEGGEDEDHAEERINDGEQLARGRLGADVTVPDRRDRDGEEVARVEHPPALELIVGEAADRIEGDEDEAVRPQPDVRAAEDFVEDNRQRECTQRNL